VLGFVGQSAPSTSSPGMVKLKTEATVMLLSLLGTLNGKSSVDFDMEKPNAGALVLVSKAVNKKVGGGYAATADDPSMTNVALFEAGYVAKARAGALGGSAPQFQSGAFMYLSVVPNAEVGANKVDFEILLTDKPLDGAACGEAFKAAGFAGCQIIELLTPGEALPPALAPLTIVPGVPGISTAAMIGYAAVGVAVAVGGIALIAKRRGRATPNRRGRRRARH
jgi:hypothetical protein